jgi:hypothetical protein
MHVKRFSSELKLLAAPKGGAAGELSTAWIHNSKPAVVCSFEEIHLRVESMTPFLRNISDFEPSLHWGINE